MPRIDVDPRNATWTKPDGRAGSFAREVGTMRTSGACRGKYAARVFAPVSVDQLAALVADRAHVTTAGVLDGAPGAQVVIFGGSRQKIEADATKLGELVCVRFGLAEVYAEVQGRGLRVGVMRIWGPT